MPTNNILIFDVLAKTVGGNVVSVLLVKFLRYSCHGAEASLFLLHEADIGDIDHKTVRIDIHQVRCFTAGLDQSSKSNQNFKDMLQRECRKIGVEFGVR